MKSEKKKQHLRKLKRLYEKATFVAANGERNASAKHPRFKTKEGVRAWWGRYAGRLSARIKLVSDAIDRLESLRG